MATEQAIEVRGLTKLYGSKAALSDVTFSVPAGTIFGFLGPNGAGKTTTIRCLMDFIRPTAGSITIFGKDAHTNNAQLKRTIGFLSSDLQLNEQWKVKEHIYLAEKIRGEHAKSSDFSQLFELDEDARVKNLSTGNKQKLSLVLALIGQPTLLIMDEPTRGLDPVLQNIMYDLLKDFASKGNTVFFSSHNLSEIQRICDGVIIIKEGNIITAQGMDEIRGANVHIVNAVTTKELDEAALKALGVQIESFDPHRVSLSVKGSLGPVITYLVKAELLDLSVSHASLEDVFLEKYKAKP